MNGLLGGHLRISWRLILLSRGLQGVSQESSVPELMREVLFGACLGSIWPSWRSDSALDAHDGCN